MIHPRFRTLVQYMDGELDQARRASVARHLLACARCRRSIEEAGGALAGLRSVDVPSARDVIARVMADRAGGMRVVLPEAAEWRPAPVVRRQFAAAAAVLLAAGMTGISLWPSSPSRPVADHDPGGCMDSQTRALASVASVFIAAACAQEPMSPPPFVTAGSVSADRIRPAEWRYETARWQDGILRTVSSTSAFRLERVPLDDRVVWRSVGETDYVRPTTLSSRDSLWLADDLRPIRQTWFYRRADWAGTILDLRYHTDSAAGSFVRGFFHGGGGRSAEWRKDVHMTLPDGPIVVASFSHSGLAHVLQSLPLERGWSGTLQTIMNGRPPARHLIPLTVAGEERITVPAGSFECWRLEVVGDRDIRMWISKREQLLVKTSSGSEGYELETVLLSYAPSSG